MPADADAKKQRTIRKRALTRLQGSIKRFIAEDNREKIEELVKKLQSEFVEFEEVHDKYQRSCEEGEEAETSEDYMVEVEERYTDCLISVNTWRRIQKLYSEAGE